MRIGWSNHREVPPLERGQIIQRVLVDGWTPAEVALFHGVQHRKVARWVAEYRRNGMASLRPARPVEASPRGLAEWLRARLPRLAALVRGGSREATPAPCIVLRRSGDERRPR